MIEAVSLAVEQPFFAISITVASYAIAEGHQSTATRLWPQASGLRNAERPPAA
jgi:hypothetical protein